MSRQRFDHTIYTDYMRAVYRIHPDRLDELVYGSPFQQEASDREALHRLRKDAKRYAPKDPYPKDYKAQKAWIEIDKNGGLIVSRGFLDTDFKLDLSPGAINEIEVHIPLDIKREYWLRHLRWIVELQIARGKRERN